MAKKSAEKPKDEAPDEEFDSNLDEVIVPGATQPPPQVKQETPPTYTHSRGYRRRAMALGATAAMIDGASPDELENWVDDAESQREAQREADRDAVAHANAMRQLTQKEVVQPAKQVEEDDLSLGEEVESALNPRISKLLKKIPGLIKENEELKKWRGEREQTEAQRRNADVIEAIDEALEQIDRTDLYGTGAASDISDKSDEYRMRSALTRAADVRTNDSPAVVRRKIAAAHNLLHGKSKPPKKAKPEKVVYGEPEDDEDDDAAPALPKLNGNGKIHGIPRDQYLAALTAKPTGRQERKQPKSPRTAASEVARILRAQNGDGDENDRTYDDGL